MLISKKNNQAPEARRKRPLALLATAAVFTLTFGAADIHAQSGTSSPVGSSKSSASSSPSSSSGEPSFGPGQKVAFAELGLLGFNGVYGSTTVPPISVGLDWGLQKNFTAGGILGFAQSSYDYGLNYNFAYTYIILAARGTYHFPDLLEDKRFDPYVALELGAAIVSSSGSGPGSSQGSYTLFGGTVGGRYWFTPNLAAQVELGFGIGVLNLGLAYKI